MAQAAAEARSPSMLRTESIPAEIPVRPRTPVRSPFARPSLSYTSDDGLPASGRRSVDSAFRAGDDDDDDHGESYMLVQRVFECYLDRRSGRMNKTTFMRELLTHGLWADDPRISQSIKALSRAPDLLTLAEFADCVGRDIALLARALRGEFIVPEFDLFCKQIEDIYRRTMPNKGGKVADYIPQLARVNPEQYGVALCTVDGQRFSIGDARTEFCVQSCCKPINYCLALEEHGVDKVHSHVGREPSGRGFNELTLNERGLPHNPLINSGAIMVCGLMREDLDMADRFDYVTKAWQRMAGGARVGFSNSTYLSERQTADRNFCLAYFMRENNGFPPKAAKNLTEVLEFYFQCCSLEMTAEAMSVVAGTLANGGVCPITNERIMSPATVRHCLSMMLSCGMYDYSGEFAFSIGIPAKSGVAGALMIVVPNVMGICTWSPRLDRQGNSVRGVDFCKEFGGRFTFHDFDELVHIGRVNGKRNPTLRANDPKNHNMVAMCFAASQGDISAVKRLLQHGASLDDCDYDGRCPLHLAASEGHVSVVHYFVRHGCPPNPRDRWGGTPLDDAVRGGKDEVVDVLRRYGGLSGSEMGPMSADAGASATSSSQSASPPLGASPGHAGGRVGGLGIGKASPVR
eukprot:Opistho-2@12110